MNITAYKEPWWVTFMIEGWTWLMIAALVVLVALLLYGGYVATEHWLEVKATLSAG